LEFQFLLAAFALVLNVKLRSGGDVQAFAGHRNGERLTCFQRVGQPPQLGDEGRTRISLLKVSSFARFFHGDKLC
jgi:hypothetical protein